MKNYLYTILCLIILTSCNNTLSKSISEPLTESEVKKEAKEHPLFEQLYKDIDKARGILLSWNSNDNEWKELTYARLLEQLEYMDKAADDPIFIKKTEDEWQQNYGMYIAKADSTSAYWEKLSNHSHAMEHTHEHDNMLECCLHTPVPIAVQQYWSYKHDHPDLDHWAKETIIKDLINPNYISKDDYFAQEWKKCTMQRDELAYKFIADNTVTYK